MKLTGKLLSTICVLALLAAGLALHLGRRRGVTGGEAGLSLLPRRGVQGHWQTAFSVMGTEARLQAAAPDRAAARQVLQAGAAALRRVDERMSSYRPESDVGRLNADGADGPVRISGETTAVLRRAAEISELTGGAFDVTYAPLRALWRRAQQADTPPTGEELERALSLVGHDMVVLKDGAASFPMPGMEVDLGGIAKGYGIDRAAAAMKEAGAEAGIVDVGGDLRLFGHPPDRRHWRVEVRRPPGVSGDLFLKAGPAAVTTSGDYERFFSVDGRRASHIIDPRTGRPVRHASSVTVVAEDATTADALATAFSVMGAEAAVGLADELPGVECMLIVGQADGSVSRELSRGFDALLEE